jgi:hypothetical protein
VGGADVKGTWSYGPELFLQAVVYVVTGMITGVAFGAALLASAPALVAYFTLPFAGAAVFLHVRLRRSGALARHDAHHRPDGGGSPQRRGWARAGTALALWMVLPLLIGAWRITRRDITA